MRAEGSWAVSDELIIARAVAYALLSGWQVEPDDCQVQVSASRELVLAGRPDAWFVFMKALPRVNARLRVEMPLGCRVELIEGKVCAVQLYEPTDRATYRW